jgi:hypothetical protein
MYRTIIASALLVGALTLPASAAPTYAWCQRTVVTNGTPDCGFTSYNQCQASISGVGGDCIRNPLLAYGAMPQGHRHPRRFLRD